MTQLIPHILAALFVGLPVALAIFAVAWYFTGRPQGMSIRRFAKEVFSDIAHMLSPAWCRLTRLWAFWGPRFTNRALWVAVFADVTFLFGANGEPIIPVDQMQQHPWALIGLVLFNLATPLRPAGAPDAIPPPPQAVAA